MAIQVSPGVNVSEFDNTQVIPAVSTNVKNSPSLYTPASIVSRVVPAIGVTIARFFSSKQLKIDD